MKIAVCEDEKTVQLLLGEKLQHLYPQAELLFYCTAEALLAASPPDILLLDIRLPGMGGMAAARALRQKGWKTLLIFITALEEYVFEAFDVGAFHYLVKPFSEEKLAAVLQSAKKELQAASPLSETPERRLLIRSAGEHIALFLDKIIYAEVFNRKVLVHQTLGDIEYYGRLSELEKQAGEDFFRSHRAYLVHFKYVLRYNASTIWLERGQALMAKQNYPAFVKSYLQYSRRAGWGGQP
jgi:two-component system LytT family response regulator